MPTNGNINDTKLGILNSDGTVNMLEIGSGVKAQGNINDMKNRSIVEYTEGVYGLNISFH